jgi:DNA-binding NtrC family response regulator
MADGTDSAPGAGASPAPSKTRPSVLLVDDEAPLREVMRETLAGEFEIETAASAEEAEAWLGAKSFDVMVCDHLMPAEQGLDFFVRHYGRWPATRRILLTGYMNPELITRSVRVAGLAACLLKPLPSAELIAAVRAAMVR